MNIKKLIDYEDKKINDYYDNSFDWYDFNYKTLTSLEGLPEDFNNELNVSDNKLQDLKGLSKNFNSKIYLYNNPIENLDGLNDVLNPNNIEGLKWEFIVSEYKRLNKYHLLI